MCEGGETTVLKLAAYVQTFLGRFDREEGQTMAEYAVILTVIAVAVLVALGLLSTNITKVLNSVASAI
jgi:Flp pilus assembly pilin Flp